jgi:hypothetical protein
MPTPETAMTARAVVDPTHDLHFSGTLDEATTAMVAYAAEARAEYGGGATKMLARRLASAQHDRVADIAAVALLRLADLQASPWPLAEGDRVRLTVDAEVFARPDPEDEPGEDWWTFAVQVCGERVLLDGMLPAEVAERVRKAPTKSTGMRACA